MADVISRALGDHYACEFARDVAQAREMLASRAFDLILCDIGAPGESAIVLGEETAKSDSDTAVVLVTETDEPAVARRAFEFGAFGYVVKPPWPGQLLMTTMNALRRLELEVAHREHSQNQDDRSQTIIDMAPMPIYAKDASGRYVLSNAKADELACVKRGEMLGQTDESIMSADGAKQSASSDRGVLADGSIYEAKEVLSVGGVSRTFKTVKFPLFDEDQRIDAVGGISADITGELEAAELREELLAAQTRAIEELKRSREETVERLTRAIDRHDSSTGEHVARMAVIAAFLATDMGFDPARVELLRAAAPMHDVGKIGTPDEILRKAGPLTAQERSIMENHALTGYEILVDSKSELLGLAATIALTHHERFDGSGYPKGLVGTEIPLEGRITAVADVFDALLSDRVYRPALPVAEAVALMEDGRGAQFDPEIVDILLDHLDHVLALREVDRAERMPLSDLPRKESDAEQDSLGRDETAAAADQTASDFRGYRSDGLRQGPARF
ncbi:MAG: HD domain-containing protein [Solirubrobacterales bacterium]|nr:HD domain-containing protein [Solirubrobacterales bacterium]